MEYGKYIVIENIGIELAILFSHIISHDEFLELFQKDSIVSAGFFQVEAKPSQNDPGDIDICVFGESTTLKKEVRTGKDEKIIKDVLRKIKW